MTCTHRWYSNKRRRLLFAGDGRRSFRDEKPQRYAEDNRTAFNCTLGESEAEVTITNCARGIVLSKLPTDRHGASRGLSTTV